MTKTKIIFGLTMLLSILATTTTAANASFTAVTNGRTSGSSQLKIGSAAAFQIVAGGEALTSSKAPDTWRIQDTKSAQNVTKEGGHLDLEIRFEEIRTASGAVITVNSPVTYQFVRTGPTTSTAKISKPVLITITLAPEVVCTVKIPASAANKELSKVIDLNIESSKALEANAEIRNINSTSEPESACKLAGITPTSTTGEFKQITIEHGVIQRTP